MSLTMAPAVAKMLIFGNWPQLYERRHQALTISDLYAVSSPNNKYKKLFLYSVWLKNNAPVFKGASTTLIDNQIKLALEKPILIVKKLKTEIRIQWMFHKQMLWKSF